MEAKRGYAVAIVTESNDYVVGQGRTSKTAVELGIVTSVTREGVVKAFRSINSETPMPIERVVGFRQLLIIPPTMIATADVELVARANHWEGYPNQLKRWNSLAELKAALKPYATV